MVGSSVESPFTWGTMPAPGLSPVELHCLAATRWICTYLQR